METLASLRFYTERFPITAIVVVNDGSSDQTGPLTAGLAPHMPIRVINHPARLGLGTALQTALSYSLSLAEHSDIIFTMAADETSDLSSIPKMINCLDLGAEVVLTSSSSPFLRRVLDRLVRQTLGLQQFRSCTTFFRAFRAGPLQRLAKLKAAEPLLKTQSFGCMAELLVLFRRANLRITELPITSDLRKRRKGKSMQIIATVRDYITLLKSRLEPLIELAKSLETTE